MSSGLQAVAEETRIRTVLARWERFLGIFSVGARILLGLMLVPNTDDGRKEELDLELTFLEPVEPKAGEADPDEGSVLE